MADNKYQEVLKNLRSKYPGYKNVSDAKLIRGLLQKHPSYAQYVGDEGLKMALSSVAEAENFKPVSGVPPLSPDDRVPPIKPEHRNLLPAFLRAQVIRLADVSHSSYRNPEDVAHVPMDQNILVDNPDLFSPGVLAHEATHVFQNSRLIQPKFVPGDYDYGEIEGLKEAAIQQKTIHNFTTEQQAAIVEDWYRLHEAIGRLAMRQNGKLTEDQIKYFEDHKNAFQPFIDQLSQQEEAAGRTDEDYGEIPYSFIPPKGSDFPEPEQKTPGLPPGEITGFTEMSPQYGGGPIKKGKLPKGMLQVGNINLNGRPVVHNGKMSQWAQENGLRSDGHSSEYSTSFFENGKEILVPTIANGRFMTPTGKAPQNAAEYKYLLGRAIERYHATGEHLGMFDNSTNADAYANQVHNRQPQDTGELYLVDNESGSH